MLPVMLHMAWLMSRIERHPPKWHTVDFGIDLLLLFFSYTLAYLPTARRSILFWGFSSFFCFSRTFCLPLQVFYLGQVWDFL